jgi:hypothetical protein
VRRLGRLRGIATWPRWRRAEIGDRYRFTGNTIGSFVGSRRALTVNTASKSDS